MSKITFEIKLLNRIIPQGMDGYKPSRKPALHERTDDEDHLNVFKKTIEIPNLSDGRCEFGRDARREFGREVTELQENMKPWKVIDGNTYGDMLIGFMQVSGVEGLYAPIYMTVRKIAYDIF